MTTISLPHSRLPRSVYVSRSIARHWLAIFLILFGIFNFLPFLAPVFMRLDWKPAGNAIYTLYSPLCHQMAQRSFFFFGSQVMYNADELPVELNGNQASDTWTLRRFRGNEGVGWKVAWSDRMVYLYGGVWLAAIAYAFLTRNRRIKPISLWLFALLLLPILLDGATHFISDLDGLTNGFRYDNAWLATLTGHLLPDSFYVGDTLGSFNSLMRLITGLLVGIAGMWLALPYIDSQMREVDRSLSGKLQQWQENQWRLAKELTSVIEGHSLPNEQEVGYAGNQT